MTDANEALPKPEDALEYLTSRIIPGTTAESAGNIRRAIESLRAHLTDPGYVRVPVAYAVFADNGNIRVWCADPIQAETLRQQHGEALQPLYTAPQPQRRPAMTDMTAEQANMRYTAIRFNMTKEQREYVSRIESDYEARIAQLFDEMNYLNNQLRQAMTAPRVPEGWTVRETSLVKFALHRALDAAYSMANESAQKTSAVMYRECATVKLLNDAKDIESILAKLGGAAPAPAEPAQDELAKLRERVEVLEEALADAASYTRHSDYDWDMGFIKHVDRLLAARLREGGGQ